MTGARRNWPGMAAHPIGPKILGYDYDMLDNKPFERLDPAHEEEAAIVRRIFQ